MRFRILTVGENKVSYLVEGETDYLKRLKHYCRIEIVSVRGEKIKENRSSDEILHLEAEKLLKQIPEKSIVVALDKHGEMLSSEDLAQKVKEWQNRSFQCAVFIIGGPLGLSEYLLNRVDIVISLSPMTFTHEMVHLILLEQLYRCFTILRGQKYHK